MLMSWTDEFSVGVAEIDQQHQRLIELINKLHDGMLAGNSKEILGDILSSLVEYTHTHFGYEEKLFAEYGYPDTEAHKQAHAALVQKIEDFKVKLESGQVMVSVEIMNFLKDWLTGHIMGVDKKYTTFLNEHGVQ